MALNVPPLPEQQAIAHVLTSLDALIADTEAAIAKLEAVRAGMLHDLLTRGVDENGELRPPSAPYELPSGWRASSVGAEFEIASGITLGKHRVPGRRGHGYLRVANVQRYHIDLSDVAQMEILPREIGPKTLETGDLLIVEGHANVDEIGRCAIVTDEAAGLAFQNHLFRLRSASVKPQMGLYLLNSHASRSYWRRTCSTSSGLNTINRTMLAAMPVVIAPEPEQERIIRYAVEQEAVLREARDAHHKLVLLRHGLSDALLTGRLRVTPEAVGLS